MQPRSYIAGTTAEDDYESIRVNGLPMTDCRRSISISHSIRGKKLPAIRRREG